MVRTSMRLSRRKCQSTHASELRIWTPTKVTATPEPVFVGRAGNPTGEVTPRPGSIAHQARSDAAMVWGLGGIVVVVVEVVL